MNTRPLACGMTLIAVLFASAGAMAAGHEAYGTAAPQGNNATNVPAEKQDAVTSTPSVSQSTAQSSGSSAAGSSEQGYGTTEAHKHRGKKSKTHQASSTSSSSLQDSSRTAESLSSGAGGNTGQSASSSASAGQQNGASAIYLIVPVETFTVSDAGKNGCWARIYGDKNFTGDQLTLSGPFSLPNMVGPFGFNWKDKVHSIEVGKAATVTVYDNENYKDQVSQFKPGAKVADVSKRMGFFDNFSSMKISCGK